MNGQDCRNVNVRIDPETKAGASQLFAQFGIAISDAINIFLRKSAMEGDFLLMWKLALRTGTHSDLFAK